MNKVLLVAALAIGGGIAYVDSRPNWDDTGVTVAAILLVTGILGRGRPEPPVALGARRRPLDSGAGHRNPPQFWIAAGASVRLRRSIRRHGPSPSAHAAEEPQSRLNVSSPAARLRRWQ